MNYLNRILIFKVKCYQKISKKCHFMKSLKKCHLKKPLKENELLKGCCLRNFWRNDTSRYVYRLTALIWNFHLGFGNLEWWGIISSNFKGKGIFKGLPSQETFIESMPQDMYMDLENLDNVMSSQETFKGEPIFERVSSQETSTEMIP